MRAGSDMRHVTVTMMREDLPRASLVLAELETFAPDDRPLLESELPEIPGSTFRDRIRRAWGHLDRLVALLGDPPHADTEPLLVLRREQLVEIDQWLADAWKQCTPCEEDLHQIEDDYQELHHLEQSLHDFAGLDIDLSRLQGGHAHLDMRIGSVPSDNLARLRDVLELSNHLILNVAGEGETLRILVAGRREDAAVLDSVLHAAAFQPLIIPESFHDNPEALREELGNRRAELDRKCEQLRGQLANWLDTNHRQFLRARQLLVAAEPYVSLHGAARSRGTLAALQGWIRAAHLPDVEARLSESLSLPFVLESREPRADERHLVPVPVQNHGLLSPFAVLVQQYGVPRFGEFDPTILFAVTFAGMFGMMFGDIGHGAIILLTGIALHRKIGTFTYLFVLAGASAMLFGWLYGSIFGVEHWLHPLWIAPMSDPIYMLTVALAWGVAFLTLGSVIAIANRLLSGDQAGALFGPGGLFSLILYLSLLGGLINLAQGDGFPPAATLVIVATLILLTGYQWQSSDTPYGERIFTTLIETFEIVNGYIASSLSFLRVAAFSLNHVALSLAVFTLADSMGTIGHWVTLVLGNLFIIVLEGVIVAIQTLRLEYYEGFSRYFYGDGTPFRPLRVGRSINR
ncbi:MAG: V-type ATP synthase subunit I [Chromatiaceae bacterium]|nr:V-type ATP synthase subunit I [Gammaproteobacteria bacterium]MCP5316584.1 V-type ATP synthase subunit I [Chromatiaceae bacterium]MCW5585748.1 ATPase [Chromatiales bacterium]MCP5429698.1 V-type ATP synthase subunit I [Chromatiaceae bacterium]MCP5434109.1 V-type ATP synthase subunit I [Chromatiaceae bacterium]